MKPLTQLIEQNNFDYVNSNITEELFPAPKTISNEYKLFHFGREISSEDAIEEMKVEGYRPSNIYELLEWTGWNGKDSVVALGSVCHIASRVPYIYENISKPYLHLLRFDGGWAADCYFLGCKLESSTSETDSLNLGNSDTLHSNCPQNEMCSHTKTTLQVIADFMGSDRTCKFETMEGKDILVIKKI